MRQGLTRCDVCGTMRSAVYCVTLDQWICASCATAKIDQILAAVAVIDKRRRIEKGLEARGIIVNR